MSAIRRITFVWNADFSVAGGLRALREAVQGQHTCTLCAIAYHRVTQTGEWKAYKEELRQRLRVEVREPCRNQLTREEREAAAGDFPAVLARTDAGVIRLLGSQDIDACDGQFTEFRRRLDAALSSQRKPAAGRPARRRTSPGAD